MRQGICCRVQAVAVGVLEARVEDAAADVHDGADVDAALDQPGARPLDVVD